MVGQANVIAIFVSAAALCVLAHYALVLCAPLLSLPALFVVADYMLAFCAMELCVIALLFCVLALCVPAHCDFLCIINVRLLLVQFHMH